MVRFPKKAPQQGAFFAFWRFGCGGLLAVLLGIGLLAAMPVRADDACPLLPRGQVVQVRQVVDGDTVRLADGALVRLIGVNTPELGRDGRRDESGARAAQAALSQLLENRRVTLVPGEDAKDRYGRLLAHLYAEGRSVEEQLVRRGFGYAVAIPPNLALVECLFAAERQARADRAGVWADVAIVPAVRLDRGGFHLLEGRVSGVFETRRGWYVELDDRVALKFDEALVKALGASWLRRLHGQRLQVRGWVVDRLARGGQLRPGHKRWLIVISDRKHVDLMPE